jgi:hypothetical protein
MLEAVTLLNNSTTTGYNGSHMTDGGPVFKTIFKTCKLNVLPNLKYKCERKLSYKFKYIQVSLYFLYEMPTLAVYLLLPTVM